jgi:ketosteroid isomerase-like protein
VFAIQFKIARNGGISAIAEARSVIAWSPLSWHSACSMQPGAWSRTSQAVGACSRLLLCAVRRYLADANTRAGDEAAIRAATREWNAAEAAKDVEKCVSFYAADGERFATGSPVIRGTDGLRKEWRKYVSSPGTFQWNTSRVEVSNSGDLAYETGKFALKTLIRTASPVQRTASTCASGKSRVTESGKS